MRGFVAATLRIQTSYCFSLCCLVHSLHKHSIRLPPTSVPGLELRIAKLPCMHGLHRSPRFIDTFVLPRALQILIFLDAMALANVQYAYVNGVEATWVPESDAYRTWIRIINLHYVATGTAQVVLTLQVPMAPAEICTSKVSASVTQQHIGRLLAACLNQHSCQLSSQFLPGWACCAHGCLAFETLASPHCRPCARIALY